MLQVVLVVMSLHPVRLLGLRWGCSRPGRRLPRRALRPRLHIRAIPCRRHCGPFHVRARGEPGWRGQDPAQGLRVVPAEGNQGAFKVAPAALLRQPDLARAAAGSVAAAETAHLAPRARTLGAPPPRPAAAICRASGEVAAVSGEAVVFARGGERVAPRAGRGVLCGAPRPPPPRQEDAQTGRGGAGGERGAGARVSPPPRRATAQGGGGVRVVVSPFVRRGAGPGGGQGRFVLAGRGRTVPGGVGRGPQCARPLPGRPALTLRSHCGRSAAGLGPSAPDKARGARRPQRRLRTEPGWPRRARGGPGLHPPRAILHVCYGVAAATRPARAGGGRGKEARRCWVTGGESRSPPAAEALQAPNSGPARAAPSLGNRRTRKVPGKDASGPRTGLSRGERRSQDRREARRRNPGLLPGAGLPVRSRTTSKEGRRGAWMELGSLSCLAPVGRPLSEMDKPWLWVD